MIIECEKPVEIKLIPLLLVRIPGEAMLKTGYDYTAIELGENFTSFMKNSFAVYSNFNMINADFEKMFMTRSDESSLNENLSYEIDQVYEIFFTCKNNS